MSNQLQDYNPSVVGEINGNLLGLLCDYESANLIVFGVPWEVTTLGNALRFSCATRCTYLCALYGSFLI